MFFTIVLSILFCIIDTKVAGAGAEDRAQSVIRLQEYLKINSAFPVPDYESAINWIKKQAAEIGLNYQHLKLGSEEERFRKFAIVLTWVGKKPLSETIGLYSHIDVVGIEEQKWNFDPFGATIKDDIIYARGSQDMKTIGVQYLEAIRNLKQLGFTPHRSVHILFLPDEEKGGLDGAKLLANSHYFSELNFGFVFDEGIPSSDDVLQIYNSQRNGIFINITATGQNGHGSLLLKNTAGEKLTKVLVEFFKLRNFMELQLELDKTLKLGDVASINLNMIEGGLYMNVIPSKLSVGIDIRYPARYSLKFITDFIKNTCEKAGEGVSYEYKFGTPVELAETDIKTESWWWNIIQNTLNSENIKFVTATFPAGTDGKYFREKGTPVLGMSPILNAKNVMHSSDEHLSLQNYFKGIEIYEKLIENLSNYQGGENSYPKLNTTVYEHVNDLKDPLKNESDKKTPSSSSANTENQTQKPSSSKQNQKKSDASKNVSSSILRALIIYYVIRF